MGDNATRFKQMIERDPSLRERMQVMARAYDGARDDDRAMFDAVVAPVATSVGVPFTYEEALDAMQEAHELSDDDLMGISGGIGIWYRLASGALVSSMIVGGAPMAAAAEVASGPSTPSVVQEYAGEDLFETDDATIGRMTEEALSGYSADFTNDDISVPEGIEATDEGLAMMELASPEVTEAFLLSGRTAKSPDPAGQNDWDRTSRSIDYTRDALGYVSKDAAHVAGYGRVLFDFLKAGCVGDYSAAFGGSVELLKLTGLLQSDEGVTNQDVIDEVKELRALVEGMSERLDETTKQTYQNRLVVFDNAVGTLDIDCQTAEAMLAKAAKIANERGEGLPAETERPTRPVPVEPTYPDEPQLVLPEEPQLILPDEPEDGGWNAMSDWQVECDDLSAEYQDAMYAYYKECDRRTAEHRKATEAWQAECDWLRANYEQQVVDAEAWDEETAVAEWEAARDADANAYMQRLVRIMEEEERSGNKSFKNFTKTMDSIESNFKLVAVECAKREGSSPFHAFDSYWALHFNFDTQGYYLRQAYRTNAEFQLKRGYALLAAYYDMTGHAEDEGDADTRESLTNALADALNGIEALPAGNSPDDMHGDAFGTRGFYLRRNVHSYTLGRSFNLTMFRPSLASIGIGDHYTEEQIKAYCSRLHGRTVAEDLRLAGLMLDYDAGWNNWMAGRNGSISPQAYLGLGVISC